MPKYKPCNHDQMVMLPISLEAQLVPGSLEYTIHEVVEKHIDLSTFDACCNNDESGASAIHPKILLKIILLAYARGMLSSRQMERACLENVTFMAMACGYSPGHSTIAAFVSDKQEEVKKVFSCVLLLCAQYWACPIAMRRPNPADKGRSISPILNQSVIALLQTCHGGPPPAD